MYGKLAGMTGTAATEADEFFRIYGLEVVEVPTNLPMRREDRSDLVFQSEDAKWQVVTESIAELHQSGRPLLIGTTSIEASEFLSGRLRQRGIPHQVLNAKNHEGEANIIAQAGRLGAVTVSTNMAGRGDGHHPGRRRCAAGGLAAGTRRGHRAGRAVCAGHRTPRRPAHRQPAAGGGPAARATPAVPSSMCRWKTN